MLGFFIAPLLEEPKWPCVPKPPSRAEAPRNSHPASRRVVVERLSSRMPSRRRVLDQRALARNLRFRARAADRRERPLRRARLVAAFSRPGARKFSCPQSIENSRNAEIFALVSSREARKWTPPRRTSSAPPHLIWSRHLSPRARKLSWLQSIENSRNEKIIALEAAK
jgi:hypothetical protein